MLAAVTVRCSLFASVSVACGYSVLRFLFKNLFSGCIDLENKDNFGLRTPIEALSDVVEDYVNSDTGLSRADIWALAALVGCDQAQGSSNVDFSMLWYGRVDCENANQACLDADGEEVPCSATRGPHRGLPNINMRTDNLYGFFQDEFGFNQRDTVAIMGAHTIGKLSPEVSLLTTVVSCRSTCCHRPRDQ